MLAAGDGGGCGRSSPSLSGGAAYTYKNYIRNPTVTVPLVAFADAHSAPMQRVYKLLAWRMGRSRYARGCSGEWVLAGGSNAQLPHGVCVWQADHAVDRRGAWEED